MVGECFINGKDAYSFWHLTIDQDCLSNLMTPAPMKPYIENKSAKQDGKRVVESHVPKKDERNIQLIFFIQARTLDSFLQRYNSFCEELYGGKIDITTKYQPGVVYHLKYISCFQFTQFNGRLGKFILKLNEPNPNNRT